jgi:hypothetical protein
MRGDGDGLKNFVLSPEIVGKLVSKPRLGLKPHHFVKVPVAWVEALSGAAGSTHQVALRLLYLHWRQGGGELKLGNWLLQERGISRYSKWRALRALEALQLIELEPHCRRSPSVRLKAF